MRRGMLFVLLLTALWVPLLPGASVALWADDSPSCTVTVRPGESIQAAIRTAPEGAVICVAAGEWAENLTISRSLTLRGAGAEATRITSSQGSQQPVIHITNHVGIRVVVEHLAVADGRSQHAHGLLLSGQADVHATGLLVRGNGGSGICITGGARAVIENSTITNNAWGLRVFDGARLTLERCVVSEHAGLPGGAHGCGVEVRDRSTATIVDCTMSRNDWGILWFHAAEGTVRNSTISQSRYSGIQLADASKVTIEENRLLSNGHYGINMAQTPQGGAHPPAAFSGEIHGSKNSGSGNGRGDVWPSSTNAFPTGTLLLDFLMKDGVAIGAVEAPGEDSIRPGRDSLLRVEADPESGFSWAYYLFVPATAFQKIPLYLLVEPNNTGTGDDNAAVHDRAARALASTGHANSLSRALGIPLLVPTFPRPYTAWHIYTHALNRNALQVTTGSWARIDLQLVHMITSAQERLRAEGLNVAEQILMHGFSASGDFVTRFALLHPALIRAYAAGGFGGGFFTLPAATWNGSRLPYPVGIDDLQSITGISFHRDAFARIARYLYLGELDANDSLGNADCYDAAHGQLIRRLLPGSMQTRWAAMPQVFTDLGFSAHFVTYPGVGHVVGSTVINDVADFFTGIMQAGE